MNQDETKLTYVMCSKLTDQELESDARMPTRSLITILSYNFYNKFLLLSLSLVIFLALISHSIQTSNAIFQNFPMQPRKMFQLQQLFRFLTCSNCRINTSLRHVWRHQSRSERKLDVCTNPKLNVEFEPLHNRWWWSVPSWRRVSSLSHSVAALLLFVC